MFGEILVEILHVVMIELLSQLATKVHPADLSDFLFVGKLKCWQDAKSDVIGVPRLH